MAEMEKEGRPPENKRSRKPAHPVKREINEEMKASFAAVIRHSCMQLCTCYDCHCASEGQYPQFHSIPLTLLGQLMSWQQSKMMGHVMIRCISHGNNTDFMCGST
ncbi:hypothetical protein STEG23_028892 [Scotinomys teguina]